MYAHVLLDNYSKTTSKSKLSREDNEYYYPYHSTVYQAEITGTRLKVNASIKPFI